MRSLLGTAALLACGLLLLPSVAAGPVDDAFDEIPPTGSSEIDAFMAWIRDALLAPRPMSFPSYADCAGYEIRPDLAASLIDPEGDWTWNEDLGRWEYLFTNGVVTALLWYRASCIPNEIPDWVGELIREIPA